MKSSTIGNFLKNRIEILKFFDDRSIELQCFGFFNENNYLQYYFNGGSQSRHKIELNKFLKNLGFKTHKSQIHFKSNYRFDDIKLAFEFVKYFKDFFVPTWKNDVYIQNDFVDFSILKFHSIELKGHLIYVDEYSTDDAYKIIDTVLKEVLFNGNNQYVDIITSILDPMQSEIEKQATNYELEKINRISYLKEKGIKVPSKKEILESLFSRNWEKRIPWNFHYSNDDLWKQFLGLDYKNHELLSDNGTIINVGNVISSYCELEEVFPESAINRNNGKVWVQNIIRYYVKGYFLEVKNENGLIEAFPISHFFEKAGILNLGKDKYYGLYRIDNDYKTLMQFSKGIFPKDLFHPIKMNINRFFFDDDYRISDFRIESKFNIIP